jgi:hypothetical protein
VNLYQASRELDRKRLKRKEKIDKAIEAVLEKKDAADAESDGGLCYCQSDEAMKMLGCAIEDLREAYGKDFK